jgi:antitoxin CptB
MVAEPDVHRPQQPEVPGGPAVSVALDAQERLDASEVNQIKWRCRRGLLENDLFIERFFARHEAELTRGQAAGLMRLMGLPDKDLLDLLLRRREPDSGFATKAVLEVLALLRTPA